MGSVADGLRAESRRRVEALSPADRIRLALQLGDADVALLCAARSIEPRKAKRLIARSRQAGRTYSGAAQR